MSELQPEKKKFWQKPENLTSALFLGGLGYMAFRGLDQILPMVNRVLDNTLHTVVVGGVLAGVVFVATQKDVHLLAWHGWRMVMRKLTEFVVTLDPIAILKGYRDHLKENLGEMQKSIGALVSQKRSLEQLIEENAKDYNREMSTANQARKRLKDDGMKRTLTLSSRQAGRLQESNLTFQSLLNKINGHLALAKKMFEVAEVTVEDISSTIVVEERKRNAIQASFKAMASARRILQGDAQREMYDAAMEHLNKDYFDKIGQIEQFMDDQKHFINGMDLQNGIFEEEALAKLEKWENEDIITKKRVRVGDPEAEQAQAESEAEVDEDGEYGSSKRQSFADLFEELNKKN